MKELTEAQSRQYAALQMQPLPGLASLTSTYAGRQYDAMRAESQQRCPQAGLESRLAEIDYQLQSCRYKRKKAIMRAARAVAQGEEV
jgi:hypothetical protein